MGSHSVTCHPTQVSTPRPSSTSTTFQDISYITFIISYHIEIEDLKWQNRLEVGADKPVKNSQYQMMMSGRFLEKPRFELAAKGAGLFSYFTVNALYELLTYLLTYRPANRGSDKKM